MKFSWVHVETNFKPKKERQRKRVKIEKDRRERENLKGNSWLFLCKMSFYFKIAMRLLYSLFDRHSFIPFFRLNILLFIVLLLALLFVWLDRLFRHWIVRLRFGPNENLTRNRWAFLCFSVICQLLAWVYLDWQRKPCR